MNGATNLKVREQIIAAWEAGEYTWEEIAEIFGVGLATVNRLIRRYRATGSIEPSPHGGGNPRSIDARGDKILVGLVTEKPDRTLDELAALVTYESGRKTSSSSVHRALVRLGFTRKKRLWSRPSR